MVIQNHQYQISHFSIDGYGIPFTSSGEYDSGLIGLYALGYAGREVYNPGWKILPDEGYFHNSIEWLARQYSKGHPSRWNQDSIFAQAVIIQVFLEAFTRTNDPAYLALAENIASRLVSPARKNKNLSWGHDDFGFITALDPHGYLTHDLESYVRVLLAFRELQQKVGGYGDIYQDGLMSLASRLKRSDAGDGILMNLVLEQQSWEFSFFNPYGTSLPPIPVERLFFQCNGRDIEVSAGNSDYQESPADLTEEGWTESQAVDDRVVRRLKAVGQKGIYTHHFTVPLQAMLLESLKNDRINLVVVYKDEIPGHLSLRMRSTHTPSYTRELTGSSLLLSGSGRWFEWHIPLRPVDFGCRANGFTSEKVVDGLHILGHDSPNLEDWATIIQGYVNLGRSDVEYTVRCTEQEKLPGQYNLAWGGLDEDGVVTINRTSAEGGKHQRVYNVALIGNQAAGMKDSIVNSLIKMQADFGLHPTVEPAYRWLANNRVSITKDAIVWNYQFDHVYNDVVMKAPWQSAIGQAYVLRALQQAVEEKRSEPHLDYEDMLAKAAMAYTFPTEEGGMRSVNRFGNVFYEEVPNNTHILNAHLVSTLVLGELYDHTGEKQHGEMYQEGLQTLRSHLFLYDTGYWLRYDLNPKKEILFQIDWIEGADSPLISEILLVNPQTGHATQLLAGREVFLGQSFPYLSGTDWMGSERADKQRVRGFRSGYRARKDSVQGGTRHNVYFMGALPDRSFKDYFDIKAHLLIIKYKDKAPGKFSIKIQSINQANKLTFTPLRNSVWICAGGGSWKQFVVKVHPQDMGWYVGPEYQRYHIALLKALAERTGDWLFKQYAEQQAAYLKMFEEGIASGDQ